MAFPTAVGSSESGNIGGLTPYLYNDNVYVIVQAGTDASKLRAFKATDPSSSFSNVGTDFAVTSGNTIVGMATVQDGSKIHVATCDYTSVLTVDIRYHVFDCSTDTWTTTNETIKDNLAAVGTNSPGAVAIGIRSDGDIIVLYNGASAAVMGTDYNRVKYARREAAVWTVDVAVDNAGAAHWMVDGLVRGASDRMHFFFKDDTADDGYQRCLTSANALEAFPAAYDTTLCTNAGGGIQGGVSYVSGGTTKVRFPVTDATLSDRLSVKLDSADAPTVSTDADITGTNSTHASTSGISYNCGMAANGTTLYFVYNDDFATGNIYFISNANDAGWSATPTLIDGSPATYAVWVYPNIYTRGSNIVIGLVWYGSSDGVKYNEYTLVAGGSAISATAAASVTWTGTSTATGAFSDTAAASVTWQGTGLYKAAASIAATASVTWVGVEVEGGTIASGALSAAAAASVTWGGTGLYPAALSSAAAAVLTWNGASIAAVPFTSAAVASVTWNGAAISAANLSAAAAAALTWNGTGLYPAAFNSAATAAVTWNGSSVYSAAATMAAVAAVTWNGTGLYSGAASIAAAATVTWNGVSTSSADLTATAAASVTWNSTAATTASGEYSMAAAATVTWGGVAIQSADLSSAAAASVTWGGTGLYPSNFSSAAIAVLAAAGAATAAGAFSSAAAANLSAVGASNASGAWAGSAVANLTAAGATTAAGVIVAAAAGSVTWTGQEVGETGNASITARASLTWAGETIAVAGQTIYDGKWWREKQLRRKAEEQEEDDMLVLAAAACALMGYMQ